jgi:hypothetical protein
MGTSKLSPCLVFMDMQGGVGVALKLDGGSRLLFVTSHLAAHQKYVARRNQDVHRIMAGLYSGQGPGVLMHRCLRYACASCSCCAVGTVAGEVVGSGEPGVDLSPPDSQTSFKTDERKGTMCGSGCVDLARGAAHARLIW